MLPAVDLAAVGEHLSPLELVFPRGGEQGC